MRLSKEKKDKISEQILSFLYHVYPESKFTAEVARDVARDEEFVKVLMNDLKNKDLVIEVKKNPRGKDYIKRARWRMSTKAHQVYKQSQTPTDTQQTDKPADTQANQM